MSKFQRFLLTKITRQNAKRKDISPPTTNNQQPITNNLQLSTSNLRLTTLFLFTFSFFSLFAQDFATLKGTLKNAKGKPLDFVNITVKEFQSFATQSNEHGNYELKIPANQEITVVFSSLNIKSFEKKMLLKTGEISSLNLSLESKENVFNEVKIVDESSRTQVNMSDVKVDNMLLPDAGGGSVETFLAAQTLGFNKANELSSNYSVRGGSYDENLVYVNGFEIYRPYLMRSGQQEGLSFPNANMISGIKFSSGGFQSQYGDKLSSVMDVSYKRPKAWGGSASASIMGFTATLEGCDKSKRFTFVAGFRQKMGTYLFNTLDTKGQYNPNFIDFQFYATYLINEKWSVELLSNYSRNQYNFQPDTQNTKFGSVSDVKQLEIAYAGQENDLYSSFNNGLALNFFPKENIKLKLLASAYNDDEREQYDIISDYRIGDVETDPGKSNYGKITSFDGYGGIHSFARNRMKANVYRAAFSGTWVAGKHTVMFGADYKHEQINDRLNQWELLDSAGYSLPYDDASKSGYGDSAFVSGGSIGMNYVLKSAFHLNSNRVTAFIQDTWRLYEDRITFNYGIRFQYWDVNKEPFVTPRVQFSFKPKTKADLVFTLSGGLYYQAPFYREMRAMDGTVNTHLKSQKSAQIVGGMTYAFKAWKRPFLFSTEVYYKYLWDLDPYQYTNVLIRYFANNNGKGFATGIDARLNGQLAEGLESWISISVMGTYNQIAGSTRTVYLDSAGNTINFVNANNRDEIKDSVKQNVGWQPRPNDQRVMFNMYFQDYIPKFPFIRINLLLTFGSGIPATIPNQEYLSNNFRLPFYRRIDAGFAGQLWSPKWAKKGKTKFNQGLKSVWLSVDVLNIFGFSNVVSYDYIKDFYGNQYAVPNYLTNRRVNVKLAVVF